MELNTLTIAAGILTGMAAASVGSYLLMRRMPLVSDSMPHIALPGIALGIVFGFNPSVGALLFLAVAVAVIWLTENKTKLPVDSIIGVLFVTSLAVGSVIVQEEELLESFFGNIEKISGTTAMVSALAAAGVLMFSLVLHRRLALTSIAPDLAESIGINKEWTELLFLILVAFTVALGINFVGVLLMSALLITPAVTARNVFGKSLRSFTTASIVIGALSMTLGLLLHLISGLPAGVSVVVVSSSLFVLSVFKVLARGF